MRLTLICSRRIHPWRHGRWLGLLLSLALLALAPLQPALARPGDWPAWPPHAYHSAWSTERPHVGWLAPTAHADWLAASYEVRFNERRLELWADFGGGARLAYATACDPDAGALVLTHPWRGIHVACFSERGALKVVYPVDYYTFAESVLAKGVGADCGLAGVVARSGPVLTYWAGGTRYFAEYYGAGYQSAPFTGVIGKEDGWYFKADGEGDAVFFVVDGRRLKAWQYREGAGWQGGEIGKLKLGGSWSAQLDAAGEVAVDYDGRRGREHWGSYSTRVLKQWWQR